MQMFHNPMEYVLSECLCPVTMGNCCYAPEDSYMGEMIFMPNENDVLFGRGGKNNKHIGNERLRKMARESIEEYKAASKKNKSQISRSIVSAIQNSSPPGRFLKRDADSGVWMEVGDDVSREKTSQALRDAVSADNAMKNNKDNMQKSNDEEDCEEDMNIISVTSSQENIPPPPPPTSDISSPVSQTIRPIPAVVSPDRSSSKHRKSPTSQHRVGTTQVFPRVFPTPDIFNEFIGQIGSDMSDFDLFNGALLKHTDSASSGSLSFIQPPEKKIRC